MVGWLKPVRAEHAGRVRVLLVLGGAAACVASAYLLVVGLGLLAFLPLGTPISVLGFAGLSLGLALVGQGILPWDTGDGGSSNA